MFVELSHLMRFTFWFDKRDNAKKFVEDEDVKLKLGELSGTDVRKVWIKWKSKDWKNMCMRYRDAVSYFAEDEVSNGAISSSSGQLTSIPRRYQHNRQREKWLR